MRIKKKDVLSNTLFNFLYNGRLTLANQLKMQEFKGFYS